MKKFNLILTMTAVMCVLVCSCEKTDADDSAINTPIAEYLYGVEYDDYDLEEALAYVNDFYLSSYPSCSEVRKGRFVGRNLDWFINTDASAIIRINHTDDHYASIGMVGCCPEFNSSLAASGKFDDVYKYMQLSTTDGINEKGVYIGVNVVPTGETSFDPEKWEPFAYGLGAAHTNPSSDRHYCVTYLVRIVLDNAGSVEEAKKIIDDIDWTEPLNFPEEGETQSFHWLICDETQSVVLDFVDNKAVYTEASGINEPSLGNIMTNFTNCLYAQDVIQDNASGLERWDILHDNYASTPETFEGMQGLMSKVWYSQTYTIDPSSRDFWFTDWSDLGISAAFLYQNYDLCDNEEFCSVVREEEEAFGDRSDWHTDDNQFWYTTHTSVYDLKSKTMRVLVHEGFDGQKDFYEVSLAGSHFAKPFSGRTE